MPKIYSRYDTPVIPGITFPEKTLTQQHFKDEVDINRIVSRAIQTGNTALFTPTQRAQFYDCSVYKDYQAALDTIGDIEDDFLSLPSSVRKEFGNDPDKYVAFMSDPRNVKKAIELGLLESSGEPKPAKPASEPKQPAAAPSETVLEPPAATPMPEGHSSS